jgi:uncharacterized membrane protein YcgQ (UPF0703/DUF1980 family)
MKKFKKFIWVLLLIILISIIVFVIIDSRNMEKLETQKTDVAKRQVTTGSSGETGESNTNKDMSKLVIGDEYFITQINDIYYNQEDYLGREVEIQGFPMTNGEYKFVRKIWTTDAVLGMDMHI